MSQGKKRYWNICQKSSHCEQGTDLKYVQLGVLVLKIVLRKISLVYHGIIGIHGGSLWTLLVPLDHQQIEILKWNINFVFFIYNPLNINEITLNSHKPELYPTCIVYPAEHWHHWGRGILLDNRRRPDPPYRLVWVWRCSWPAGDR